MGGHVFRRLVCVWTGVLLMQEVWWVDYLWTVSASMDPSPFLLTKFLYCCRLVKFALKESDFRHPQCHHSTYIYSLLMPCILPGVNASSVLDLALLFSFFQGWNLDVLAMLPSNKIVLGIVSCMLGPVVSGKWLLVAKCCLFGGR